MGPKKSPVEDEWKRKIENAPLNDLFWKAKVIIIETAGSEQDRIYLSKFEDYAAEDKRFVIKNISKTETMFMINQLGSEKKGKDDTFRIFEECQMYLKEKQEMPTFMIALTIKHLMLKLKQEYLIIQKQRLLVKEGLQKESMTMIETVEVKNIRDIQSKFSEPEKPNKSKKLKGIESAINIIPDVDKKYNTKLRIRGEEWRDKTYINDYPTDGPNLYIAVSGFQDPYLAEYLIKLGIPVTAIVQVRIDSANNTVPSPLTRPTKRGQDQADTLMGKCQQFWEELQLRRVLNESSEILKDTAFIIFSPPYWENTALSGNSEKIYNEVCYLLYDVQDLSRQHLNYLSCITITQIPTDSIDNSLYLLYQKSVEDIPLESLSVYSILDGILQVVSNCYDSKDINLTTCSTSTTHINLDAKIRDNRNKIVKTQDLTENIFNELISLNKNIIYRPTIGEEFENYKEPIVINYGDFSKIKTFHLYNRNLECYIRSMLLGMPIHCLWNQLFKPEENEVKINFHKNLLISCFERKDLNSSELNRLLNILACRKLYNNRSSKLKQHIPESTIVDFKKKYLKRSILAEPFINRVIPIYLESPKKTYEEKLTPFISPEDSQNIHLLFECPDITELVSVTEIESSISPNHIINEYDYFEDYTGINSFQMLNEFFCKYNCVDYKYCKVTDSIILMFFNSHDKDGVERVEWRKHLPTPVCLQDFFDFVFEERYHWVIDQEKKYDEMMELRNKSEYSDVADVIATKSCTDLEPGPDLLMEGSIKYKEYVDKLEIKNDSLTEIKASSKKSIKKSTATSVTSSKRKTTATSTPKSTLNLSSIQSSNSQLIPCLKKFLAYNLGDRRIEILGKNSNFYSKEGTTVSTDYYIKIPENIEYVSLRITPGYSSNVIRLHRALGEFNREQYADKHESFCITTVNNVLINIIKQKYKILQIKKPSITDFNSKNIRSPSPDLNENTFSYEIYHKVIITWPNGNIIETIHEENSSEITHIKQHFINSPMNIDEDMRCINIFGEVVIFKSNGHIEVLRPDGNLIYITKCEKILIIYKNDNYEKSSNSSSNKNLKSKQKSSKSSKSTMKSTNIRDESPISSKLLLLQEQYELKIEDFYSIDSNGIKETYVNGNLSKTEKILVRTATDYNLPEVFSRRMDETYLLINKDGVQVLTFHDKTRIIKTFFIEECDVYPEWTIEEIEYFGITPNTECTNLNNELLQTDTSHFVSKDSYSNENINFNFNDGYVSVLLWYTIEHPQFATVKVNPYNKHITIESPNNITVDINEMKLGFKMDENTEASFDGHKLNIVYKPCNTCSIKTLCEVNILKEENENANEIYWLKMVDPFGKRLLVTEAGEMIVTDTNENELIISDKQNSNINNLEKNIAEHVCKISKTSRNQKFFILRRDLTSSELVHRDVVEELRNFNKMDPWFSINSFDTFGDYRKILSILSPIYLNESEKWLMESKLANKPQYLKYKDLKKDEGKGFYHWMRPYGRYEPKPRKPANVLASHFPKAFVLRTFEQQWSEENRDKLMGARELVEAILRYRKVLESDYLDTINLHIDDPRTDDERNTDEIIQNIGHKVYMDLKNRLENDIYENMVPGITTKEVELPGQAEEFIEQEELNLNYMENNDAIIELEKVVPLSSNLKRYWRNRAAEVEQEQFYKELLSEHRVTSYFNNLIGGAVWWEVNNITSKVADVAESVKKELNK